MKLWVLLLVMGVTGVLFTGCRPELAQVEQGEREAAWDSYFKANYSSYNPPRNAPPATYDNRMPEAYQNQEAKNTSTTVIAEEVVLDAEVTEDNTYSPVENSAETAVVPVEEPQIQDYTVVGGDTLSGIAKKFYKNGNKYRVILDANPALKGNPNKIYPGMRLIIPQL